MLTKAFQVAMCLALGLAVVALLAFPLRVKSDAVLTIGLVLPSVLILGISGLLAEITTPGISAKFRATARKPVKLTLKPVMKAVLTIEKGAPDDFAAWKQQHPAPTNEPVVLLLKEGVVYQEHVLDDYVAGLAGDYPTFVFVVIIDRAERVIAYVSVKAAVQWSEDDRLALAKALEGANRKRLLTLEGVEHHPIKDSDRVVDALDRMARLGETRLLVVDSEGKIQGAVDQETATAQLVLSLLR